MFEALAMAMIEREMPINRIAQLLRVHPQRIWNVFNHWVTQAREADVPLTTTRLGMDETSTRKGHHYITLGVDMDTRRVIHVCEGNVKQAVADIKQALVSKHIAPEQISQISMDLSPAYIAGVAEHFPVAKRRARGYQNLNNFINMINFLGGKMKFNYSFYCI
jgi:transposase